MWGVHLSRKIDSTFELFRRIDINKDMEINPGYNVTLTPSPGRDPRLGSYFVSRSPDTYGISEIKFKDLLLDQISKYKLRL